MIHRQCRGQVTPERCGWKLPDAASMYRQLTMRLVLIKGASMTDDMDTQLTLPVAHQPYKGNPHFFFFFPSR